MRKILIIMISILMLYSFGYSREALKKNTKIRIVLKNTVITATLYHNSTTKAFLKKLPLTLKMKDLYGRELVYRFKKAFPVSKAIYRGYKVGEIIYYPPLHSFVLMYAQNGERFTMQRMGKIDFGIEKLKGIGNTTIRFEQMKN